MEYEEFLNISIQSVDVTLIDTSTLFLGEPGSNGELARSSPTDENQYHAQNSSLEAESYHSAGNIINVV